MSAPDIEIYLAGARPDAILAWLQQRFPESTASALRPAGKRQWRVQVSHGSHAIPVLVIEEAAPGFTSVWFDSPQTPWPDDISCAREAFAHFRIEVRATPGSWQEGDDPDLWWHIDAAGEGPIHWPG